MPLVYPEELLDPLAHPVVAQRLESPDRLVHDEREVAEMPAGLPHLVVAAEGDLRATTPPRLHGHVAHRPVPSRVRQLRRLLLKPFDFEEPSVERLLPPHTHLRGPEHVDMKLEPPFERLLYPGSDAVLRLFAEPPCESVTEQGHGQPPPLPVVDLVAQRVHHLPHPRHVRGEEREKLSVVRGELRHVRLAVVVRVHDDVRLRQTQALQLFAGAATEIPYRGAI